MKKIYLIVLLLALVFTSCSNQPTIDNIEPVARFTNIQTTSGDNSEFLFDAGGSSDEDGNIVAYRWRFGDGKIADGYRVSHKYSKAGSYRVYLTVVDNKGGSSSISKTIIVNKRSENSLIIASFSVSNKEPKLDELVFFDAEDSAKSGVAISSYLWDFGDKVKLSGVKQSHKYKQPGKYLVTLTVTNNLGESSSVSKQLVVGEASIYHPPVSVSWQWQLDEDNNKGINTGYKVEVYDLDLFDVDKKLIDRLHSKGIKVICYFSAGSFEDWRPDAKDFPESVLGKRVDGWSGEKWLDIRSTELGSIMEKRLDLAVSKGCDGVEPDNMDGWEKEHNKDKTGFHLKPEEQLKYNSFIAEAAHKRGLSVGLKNDLQQVKELVGYFDFAVNEQCFEYKECGLLSPFIERGKPVLNAEYKKKYVRSESARKKLCSKSKEMSFSTLILPEDLNDKFRLSCSEI